MKFQIFENGMQKGVDEVKPDLVSGFFTKLVAEGWEQDGDVFVKGNNKLVFEGKFSQSEMDKTIDEGIGYLFKALNVFEDLIPNYLKANGMGGAVGSYHKKIGFKKLKAMIENIDSVNESRVEKYIVEKKIVIGWDDNTETFIFGKTRVETDYSGEFEYRGVWFDTNDHSEPEHLIRDLEKAFPKDKFVYECESGFQNFKEMGANLDPVLLKHAKEIKQIDRNPNASNLMREWLMLDSVDYLRNYKPLLPVLGAMEGFLKDPHDDGRNVKNIENLISNVFNVKLTELDLELIKGYMINI